MLSVLVYVLGVDSVVSMGLERRFSTGVKLTLRGIWGFRGVNYVHRKFSGAGKQL